MAIRTTSQLVKSIMGDDYGPRADGSLPDLTPYIVTANEIVDQVVIDAAKMGVSYSAPRLELIERWLAAHYYTKADPAYTSRSTSGASGSFIRAQEEPEPYRNVAVDLDTSGALNAILRRNRARLVYLGKRPSEQIPIDERD